MVNPNVDPRVSPPASVTAPTSIANQPFDHYLRQWRFIVFSYALLLVLATTLFPFLVADWAKPAQVFDVGWLLSQFRRVSPLDDAVMHFALFMPFGFGYALLLYKPAQQSRPEILAVIVGCVVLGLALEIAQAFIPSRTPAIFEAMVNILGGLLGAWLFYRWGGHILSVGTALVSPLASQITPKGMAIWLLIYLTLLSIAIYQLRPSINYLTSFENWRSYPLLVGNERTANRAWQGQISDFALFDQALTADQVAHLQAHQLGWMSLEKRPIAYYQFSGSSPYADQMGHLPHLLWRGKPSGNPAISSASVSGQGWLETSAKASYLNHHLSQRSQLTLLATIAPTNVTQSGPARIISVSNNPFRRNFTLGQNGEDLIFRLRTPLTGLNGMEPQLVANHVFAANAWRQIVITYDQTHLKLYVDGQLHPQSLNLRPTFEGTIQLFLAGQVSSQKGRGYLLITYLVLFWIFGLFLAYFMQVWHRASYTYTLIGLSILLAIPILFESFIAFIYESTVRADSLFLASILLFGFTSLIRIQIYFWQKPPVA